MSICMKIVEAIEMGSIIVEILVRGKIKTIHIENVFHMPKLQAKLPSVTQLLSSGLNVQFNLNKCIVRGSNGKVVAIVLHEGTK